MEDFIDLQLDVMAINVGKATYPDSRYLTPEGHWAAESHALAHFLISGKFPNNINTAQAR
jgi:hypothetical protein